MTPLTKEDLQNLEVVFNLARRTMVDNENELIKLINFRKTIFDKLKEETEPNPLGTVIPIDTKGE